MIRTGAAPAGSAYTVIDVHDMAAVQISGSKVIGPGTVFNVWGSAQTGLAGGEPNNIYLGIFEGTDGAEPSIAPPLGIQWASLIFQKKSGVDSGGNIEIEGQSWSRAAPVSRALPTTPGSYSAPLDFTACNSAFVFMLDAAATSGDSYLVWGTNDSTTRSPASAAGGGQLQGGAVLKGGGAAAVIVIGYQYVIVKCVSHGAATNGVAVELVNDGFTLVTPTGGGPGTPWIVGGNANGSGTSVLGTTDGSDTLQVKGAGVTVLTADGTNTTLAAASNAIVSAGANVQLNAASHVNVLATSDIDLTTSTGAINLTSLSGPIAIDSSADGQNTTIACGAGNFEASAAGIELATLNMLIGNALASGDPSALLELRSTVGGFLVPRMTTAQRNAINGGAPAKALVIYNTDLDVMEINVGTSGSPNWIQLGGDSYGWTALASLTNGAIQYLPPGYAAATSLSQLPGCTISKPGSLRSLTVNYVGDVGNTHGQTVNFQLLDRTLTLVPGAQVSGPVTAGAHSLSVNFTPIKTVAGVGGGIYYLTFTPSAALDAVITEITGSAS